MVDNEGENSIQKDDVVPKHNTKVIEMQSEIKRKTTWYFGVQEEINRYGIELTAEDTIKSTWKRHLKEKIGLVMQKEISEACSSMTKQEV